MARDASTPPEGGSTKPGAPQAASVPTTEPIPTEGDRLGADAGPVSAATLASRVLGVVREQVMAGFFGAGYAADAFNIAFRVPNLLRDLFAEGALSAAFVPTFTETMEKKGRADAWRLGAQVVNVLAIVLIGVVVVGWFAAPLLVRVMAPGFAEVEGKTELTVFLARVMLPFLLFVALAAAAAGMLNSLRRFTVPALAPVWFNVGTIALTVALVPVFRGAGLEPITAMALGVLAGGLLQLVVQLPRLWKLGFRPAWPPRFRHPGVGRVAGLMAPAALGLSAVQINVVVNSLLASLVGPGAVSWLAYAFRVLFVPIGLFGVALGTVSLPTLSRDAARGDLDALKRNLGRSIRLVSVLTLPAAFGLAALAHPLIALLFERGRFTATDTDRTAEALIAYCVGLAAYAGIKALVPAFYALGDTRTPVKASFLAVAVNVALNLALMGPLGHVGLALATGLAALFNFVQLWAWLRRKIGALPTRAVAGTVLRALLASALMGAALAAGVHATRPLWETSLAGRLAVVGGAVPLGAVVVYALYRLAGVEERHELRSAAAALLRRLTRRG